MRYITLAFLSLITLNASAQETDKEEAEETERIAILPKERRNEIGLLSELGVTDGNAGPGIGIQFKHWTKGNTKAIRANVGYTQYTHASNKAYFPAQGDTVLSKTAITVIPTIQAGIGLEKQRHFYKNIYLYAAIDLYAAYGSGTTKEYTQKEVNKDNLNYIGDSRHVLTYSSEIFKVGVMPMVGAKFQFKRISFGTEISGLRMEYNSVSHGKGGPANGGGIADFNMGQFNQRIFVNFRF